MYFEILNQCGVDHECDGQKDIWPVDARERSCL